MVESYYQHQFEQTTQLESNRFHRDGVVFKKKKPKKHFRQSSSLERLAQVSFTSSDEEEESNLSDSLKEFELMYRDSQVKLPGSERHEFGANEEKKEA